MNCFRDFPVSKDRTNETLIIRILFLFCAIIESILKTLPVDISKIIEKYLTDWIESNWDKSVIFRFISFLSSFLLFFYMCLCVCPCARANLCVIDSFIVLLLLCYFLNYLTIIFDFPLQYKYNQTFKSYPSIIRKF